MFVWAFVVGCGLLVAVCCVLFLVCVRCLMSVVACNWVCNVNPMLRVCCSLCAAC